jgi:hypothetical protein
MSANTKKRKKRKTFAERVASYSGRIASEGESAEGPSCPRAERRHPAG